MSTEKQIAANRLNAQKSTGPRTLEGRAAVRLNGVKHGLTATTLVLKGESEAGFTTLLESYEAEHEPSTPTEEALVQQLAMATWRLRRLYHAEGGFYVDNMHGLSDKLDDSVRLAIVTQRNAGTMATFNRQETRLERTFYKALHELQRLKKERPREMALVSPSIRVERAPAIPTEELGISAAPPPILRSSQPPRTSETVLFSPDR
jgi:hypothetical protein